MKKYDLIVVGAGPAGLLAAKAAGLQGLEVALLERKSDMTIIDRTCGQVLIYNGYFYDDMHFFNHKGKRMGFCNNGFSFSYDGPKKNVYAWHIYSPGGKVLPFGMPQETRRKGEYGAVGLAFDKEIFFRCLLKEVKTAGVDIFSDINVNEISTSSEGVKISGSNKTFVGAYAIAADGTNSIMAKQLGFNKERIFYCYLLTKGWYMQGVEPHETDIVITTISYKAEAPSFMWLFPRPYKGETGVFFMAIDPRVNLDEVADHFMKEDPVFSLWFKKAEKLKAFSSAQYVFSPIAEPYRNRVLLSGDTAATIGLDNSGSMISGWKAGNAIATTFREEKIGLKPQGISNYLQWWKKIYDTDECPHKDYLMNFLLPYVIDCEEDLDYIFSYLKDPLPPCWEPYAAIKIIGQFVQSIVPSLQKERPDILTKLSKMSNPLTEILAETIKACQPLDNFG